MCNKNNQKETKDDCLGPEWVSVGSYVWYVTVVTTCVAFLIFFFGFRRASYHYCNPLGYGSPNLMQRHGSGGELGGKEERLVLFGESSRWILYTAVLL